MGKMKPGESARTIIDQITEGQVTWVPMDTEFDVVNSTINKMKPYLLHCFEVVLRRYTLFSLHVS